MAAAQLVKLANEQLEVTVYDDASADLVCKSTGRRWRMGPVATQEDHEIDNGDNWLRTSRSICEQYPGRFHGTKHGDEIRFMVFGRLGREMGSFTCRYRLDGPWLEVLIGRVDDTLPNLMFPPAIESAQLLLPLGVGKLIRTSGGLYDRHAYRFFGNLNMRFFAGLDEKGAEGWMAVVDDGHADAGVLQTQLHATPIWMKSLGKWPGERTVRYRFTTGGYVGVAKAFRQFAQERGMFLTLKEKIDRNPAIDNLVGGRVVSFMQARSFYRSRYEDRCQPIPQQHEGRPDGVVTLLTHAQSRKIIDECKSLGMKRGMFHLHGWINKGYDETHPDVWPPEPSLGTIEELRELCGEQDPYITCLHDNYQDIYEQSHSFPKGVCVRRDRSLLPGGVWAGGLAYILNGTAGLHYAKRNWEHLKTLALRAIYSDTITAEQFRESYEPGHHQTRSQDEQLKKDLMQFFLDQELLLASENGMDWGVPYIAWSPVGPHVRVVGESVPLWPLVYHDCVMGVRGVWSPEDVAAGSNTRILDNMLWGYVMTIGGFTAETWPNYRQFFSESFHVDHWHSRIGTAEMLSHRYLTDDHQVEMTEFSTGEAIVVNYADEPRQVDGMTVVAKGYAIRS